MTMLASPEFEGFFENVSRGRVCLPRCADCGRFHWYPMPLCPHCQSARIEWRQVLDPARLYTWTVVRHPFDPGDAGRVPYIVGLVVFGDAPGIRLITTIADADPTALTIDMVLEPVFERRGGVASSDGKPAISFRPKA